MINKFYAPTEPVIPSIVEDDLGAKFPFELSLEEAALKVHPDQLTYHLERWRLLS